MYKETRKNKKSSETNLNLISNIQSLNSKAGITLIALIITIIILLILAMTSVALVMRNGIIKHTQDAAEKYQIAAEKEEIELAYEEYVMDGLKDKNADLKMDEKEATVESKNGEGGNKTGWAVKFKNSGNVYDVDNNGNITGPKNGDSLVGGETDTGGGSSDPKDEPSTKPDKIIEGQTWENVEIKNLPQVEPEILKTFEETNEDDRFLMYD